MESQNGCQQGVSKACMGNTVLSGIPVIDMGSPQAKAHMVEACEEFGFFKLVNHGIPKDYASRLEEEGRKFFGLPQSAKDLARPAQHFDYRNSRSSANWDVGWPFGYGNRRIGANGDEGWIEYLLLSIKLDSLSQMSSFNSPETHKNFRSAVSDYASSVKKMAEVVLEMIAQGLGIEPRNGLSRLVGDEESDSILRVNHYPPWPAEHEEEALKGQSMVGFGEHTDPQIISVLRSNKTNGLEICLKDGTWLPVPPDQDSFFINVGDTLQVMTNGRFKSVKHRVVLTTNGGSREVARLSTIYFGGPPLKEIIAPFPSLLKEGEVSLYRDFTWADYKKQFTTSRLADNRLSLFEKTKVLPPARPVQIPPTTTLTLSSNPPSSQPSP